jgi:UDP-N-acetylglucosamine transferase subunit ALG13
MTSPAASNAEQLFVLVTVGSTGFDDLVQAVDEAAPKLNATGLAQVGPGSYRPTNLPYERFVPSLAELIDRADVVIAHGGAATTLEALSAGAKLVSVANPDRYDDHQNDVLAELSGQGHLVWCRDLDGIADDISHALSTDLRPIDNVECTIGRTINDFLRERPQRRLRWPRKANA